MKYPFSDVELSRRMERTEAKTNAAFVESRAQLSPNVGATWQMAGGTYALFDGVDSPVSQTFGFGLFEAPSVAILQELEEFFTQRKAATYHEVSPLAAPETMEMLSSAGYEPFELTSVMFRPIDPGITLNASDAIQVRRVDTDESALWTRIAAKGWSETPGLEEFMNDIGRIASMSRNSHPFLAEIDGVAVGAGSLSIHDGVALVNGASTVPDQRRRGAQLALLERRLRYAAEHGCDLAIMGAHPGSASQRNAERQGFRIAYTRMKWKKRR